MFIRHMPGQSSDLTVMTRSAKFAGKSLNRDFEELEHLQVSKRSAHGFIKAAEEKVSNILIKDLSKARPDYGILIEGKKEKKGKDPRFRWIIDPLDGTNNFGHGIPYFAISIAIEKDGEIISGVVYDIIHNRFYFAEKGFGCYVNGRRLRVSGRISLDNCMMITNYHMQGAADQKTKQIKDYFDTTLAIAPNISGFRSFGAVSLDLAYIAAGKSDGIWLKNYNLWDVAAGIILIKEAGGFISDFNGKKITDKSNLIAGNAEIHKQLLNITKEI